MLALQGLSRCETHQAEKVVGHLQAVDELRVRTQALYNTKRWKEARRLYLAAHPLCASCAAVGRVVAANVVDHVRAHQGDEVLFWDESNWQGLCDYRSAFNCHGRKTGREAAGRRG